MAVSPLAASQMVLGEPLKQPLLLVIKHLAPSHVQPGVVEHVGWVIAAEQSPPAGGQSCGQACVVSPASHLAFGAPLRQPWPMLSTQLAPFQ